MSFKGTAMKVICNLERRAEIDSWLGHSVQKTTENLLKGGAEDFVKKDSYSTGFKGVGANRHLLLLQDEAVPHSPRLRRIEWADSLVKFSKISKRHVLRRVSSSWAEPQVRENARRIQAKGEFKFIDNHSHWEDGNKWIVPGDALWVQVQQQDGTWASMGMTVQEFLFNEKGHLRFGPELDQMDERKQFLKDATGGRELHQEFQPLEAEIKKQQLVKG